MSDEEVVLVLKKMTTYLLAKLDCALVQGDGAWEKLSDAEKQRYFKNAAVKLAKKQKESGA